MIGEWTLSAAAHVTGGDLRGSDHPFNAVSTDSRQKLDGCLFVALRGDRFDGHDFVAGAAEQGAVAVLVDHDFDLPAANQLPRIVVDDTLIALGKLGAANRDRFKGPLIAVTGSCGKTTVKEMLASICGQQGLTLATEGNLNNHIGAPLTLLSLSDEHRFAVVELGASAEGEIAYTVGLSRPDVSLITIAAEAHLKGFGSLEGVIRAKGEIYRGLPLEGKAVLNLDEPAADKWHAMIDARPLFTFSAEGRKEADFRAESVEITAEQGSTFVLATAHERLPVSLPVLGRHNVANAMAAATAAAAIGIPLSSVAAGLSEVEPARGRLQMHRSGSMAVIDDTYNANPRSVRAAINVLSECRGGSRTLVLGQMAELGDDTESFHRQLGEYARSQGIESLWCLGELGAMVCEGFAGGHWFLEFDALMEALLSSVQEGEILLVKGSRSMKMERVVDALLAAGRGDHAVVAD